MSHCSRLRLSTAETMEEEITGNRTYHSHGVQSSIITFLIQLQRLSHVFQCHGSHVPRLNESIDPSSYPNGPIGHLGWIAETEMERVPAQIRIGGGIPILRDRPARRHSSRSRTSANRLVGACQQQSVLQMWTSAVWDCNNKKEEGEKDHVQGYNVLLEREKTIRMNDVRWAFRMGNDRREFVQFTFLGSDQSIESVNQCGVLRLEELLLLFRRVVGSSPVAVVAGLHW